MSDAPTPRTRNDDRPVYEIRITGHLDHRWGERFEGLSLNHDPDGTTTLRGPVLDQAALHSLLRTVRDLALPLVSVIRVNGDQGIAPLIDAHRRSTHSTKENDT